MLVVSHVLIDQSSLNVDTLVVLQQTLHSRELNQGVVEFLCPSVHESQMEHRCDKRTAPLKCISEEDNGVLNFLFFQLTVVVLHTRNHLSLSLVCKTLGVIELSIPILSLDSGLEILVS
jgi:hypothetical protein